MPTQTTLKDVSGKPDLVALVDVLFLLLMFFLLRTAFFFQPGIPVELPQAESATVQAAEKILVTITRPGKLYFNDEPVSWGNLERALREVVLESRVITEKRLTAESRTGQRITPKLVLRADARVPYERIVQVTSLARSLGLGVYLLTETQNKDITAPAGR